MTPALLILAAGLGSRYGAHGQKQLAAVGPDGEIIAEYLIFDALRAGFGDIVLVVREGMEADLGARLRRRFGDGVPVRFAVQRLSDLPPGAAVPEGRTRPWGTTHAVLAGARGLTAPFGVVNADDLYGHAAFECLGGFLANPEGACALVAFPLYETLSASGGVNRGVCRVSAGRWLDRIREVKDLTPHNGGAQYRDETGALHVLPGDTPVSMNMWGFTPAAVAALDAQFGRFLDRHGSDRTAEHLLPAAVEELVRDGKVRVKVLTGPFHWAGVTYPADRELVARTIARLIGAGVYPSPLHA
jgi:hypothetical protein